MRSVRSMVEHRFESYSGRLFSAMKTEYVVVAEQAYPLGPAYSIIPYNKICRRELCMLLLLYTIILCLAAYIQSFFSDFWHCRSYIHKRFNENFLHLYTFGLKHTCMTLY